MRAIGWYLTLVGVPVAALLAILRFGERLQPPRAVHGQYTLAFDSIGGGQCLATLVSETDRRLAIEQSGPRLEMTFGGTAFVGRIVGDSIRAAAVTNSDSALLRAGNCLTVDTIRISAALARESAGDARLDGRFVFSGCRNCPAVPFQALRLPDRRSRG